MARRTWQQAYQQVVGDLRQQLAPLGAAFRQGLGELAQILPAFPDSVRTAETPGTIFNKTPLEAVSDKYGLPIGQGRMLEQGNAWGNADRLLQANVQTRQQVQDKGKEQGLGL